MEGVSHILIAIELMSEASLEHKMQDWLSHTIGEGISFQLSFHSIGSFGLEIEPLLLHWTWFCFMFEVSLQN